LGNPGLCVEDFDHPAFVVLLVSDGIPPMIGTVMCRIAFSNVVSGDHIRRSKVLLQVDRGEVAERKRPLRDSIDERAPDARTQVSVAERMMNRC